MGRVWSRVAASFWFAGLGAAALSVGCGRTAQDIHDDQPNGMAGTNSTTEQPALDPNCAVSIAGNDGRHCAVYQDGSVWCWGAEGDGEGPRDFERSAEPRRVEGLDDAQRIVVGPRHSCALRNDSQLLCWGDNESGQIADSMEPTLPPTQVRFPADTTQIKGFGLGDQQTCALGYFGRAFCQGTDAFGSIGNSALVSTMWPPDATMPGDGNYVIDDEGAVYPLAEWTRVLAMPQYGSDNAWFSGPGTPSCVLKRSGSLWCTSSDPNLDDARFFAKASLGERVSQAGTGNQFWCALSEGQVWCEGLDRQGQTASGGTQDYAEGHFVAGLSDVRSLSVNDYSACALLGDGTVWCWGSYAEGHYSAPPTRVSGCMQQSVQPEDPQSSPRPTSATHLSEGALARAQAMCACTFGEDPPQSCIDAENVAPNASCLAALLPGLNPWLDCRATSLWQDADCYAKQVCAAGGTVRACMSLTCPPGVLSASVASYCQRRTCALDLEHSLSPNEICDGTYDCDDGSDERNCRDDLSGSFECNPETRIPLSKVCDAVPDCNDGSDEQYCGG